MEETKQNETTEPTGGESPEKPIEGSLPKADTSKRAFALLIDAVISMILSLIPAIGGFLGAAYMLLRDGFNFEFMDGRSIGKKVMKIRPVSIDGAPMDIGVSIRRNWIFAVPMLFLVLPLVGLLLAPIASLVIGIVEIYLVVTTPDGRRWGDKLANTQVVDSTD